MLKEQKETNKTLKETQDEYTTLYNQLFKDGIPSILEQIAETNPDMMLRIMRKLASKTEQNATTKETTKNKSNQTQSNQRIQSADEYTK